VGWLVDNGAQVVVVACNTATSAAMDMLRAEFTIPLVGMEPGIKPAIASTRSGQVGVLATGGTLAGDRFASLIQRFARNVNVQMIPCPGLVRQVEAGDLDGPQTRGLLQRYLYPLQQSQVDTIVLGCSHFHFLAPVIAELTGPGVTIIDTGPAVARQVMRVAARYGVAPHWGTIRCGTTGDPQQVAALIARLWGGPLPVEHVAC
jgi:glutamate racemase